MVCVCVYIYNVLCVWKCVQRRIWVREMSLEKLESNTDVTGISLSLSLSHTHTRIHKQKIEFHSSWFTTILCHDSWMLHVCWVCMHEINLITERMFCYNSCQIHFFWICHVILLYENHIYSCFMIHQPFSFFLWLMKITCMLGMYDINFSTKHVFLLIGEYYYYLFILV